MWNASGATKVRRIWFRNLVSTSLIDSEAIGMARATYASEFSDITFSTHSRLRRVSMVELSISSSPQPSPATESTRFSTYLRKAMASALNPAARRR